ncbi:lysophospholipase [Bacteriovoracaceae bacterium]|nr:lysophospholipase [Bacteriovoracaceae bacterium]
MIFEKKILSSFDGIELELEIKETGAPSWLIITHGIGEHLRRHYFLAELFSGTYNFLFYDLRGHGKSQGKRVYVDNFSNYYRDLGQIIWYLKENYRMERYNLFGHSMGGLITAGYVQKLNEYDFYPSKVFLSSPFLQPAGKLGRSLIHLRLLLQKLSKIKSSIAIKGLIDLKGLSHDSRIVEEYMADELVSKSLESRLLLKMVEEGMEVFSKPLNCLCPLACSVGQSDRIVSTEAIVKYFRSVESNAQLKVIGDGYHELHNEVQRIREKYFDFLKSFF